MRFSTLSLCLVLLLTMTTSVSAVHETPLTVGGLIDSAITHGDYVSKTVAAGNIARIGYVIFIHEMNNFIATLEPTGEFVEAIVQARSRQGFVALCKAIAKSVDSPYILEDHKWMSLIVAAYKKGMSNSILVFFMGINLLDFYAIIRALEQMNIDTATSFLKSCKTEEELAKVSDKKKAKEKNVKDKEASLAEILKSNVIEQQQSKNAKDLKQLDLEDDVEEEEEEEMEVVAREPKKTKVDYRGAEEEEDEKLESPELFKQFLIIEQMDLQYKVALSKIEELEGRVSRRDYLIDSQNALLVEANISLVVPEATQEPTFFESQAAE